MSALKQNPFLTGFGVVLFVGVAGLGYLAYSAMSDNSAAFADYKKAESDLNGLYNENPTQERLDALIQQKKELEAKTQTLQSTLASMQFKGEDITDTGFQDQLKQTLNRITAKAAESDVVLTGGANNKDKFTMDFAKYLSEPPNRVAAPPLLRQLRGIEAVLDLILQVKTVEVLDLKRDDLPEEKSAKAPEKKGGKAEEKPMITRTGFNLKILTTQENFQRILNGLVSSKQQLYVVRNLSVKNEKQEAPTKTAAVVPQVVPQPTLDANGNPVPAQPGAAADEQKAKLEYVFGKEKVEADLRIEIVDVAAPDLSKAERSTPSKADK